MARKLRKTRRSSAVSSRSSQKKSRGISRRATRQQPKVAPRIKTNVIRRSTNTRRVQQRTLKRQAVRKAALTTHSRPRPVVRPPNPPRKIMVKRPAPRPATQTTFKSARRSPSVRPKSRISAQQSKRRRNASIGIAGAVAASGAFLLLKSNLAHPDIAADVSSLQSSLNDLQNRSTFNDIATDITNLDSTLNSVLNLLESAREKGYAYQADMEDIAYNAMDSWESARAKVEQSIVQQSQLFQNNLITLDSSVQRLNATLRRPSAASSELSNTQSKVNELKWDIDRAENAIEEIYDEIESDMFSLNGRLTKVHWALDQLSEAKFDFEGGEDLVMAVPARWDQKGKNDPEGILYLSNKRLVFERKEKVATKKVLFITTASELVQEVSIAQSLEKIKDTKAKSKGLFGHQDFLTVEFADKKIGTVEFHINGQDSEQWSNLIRRAKSGEIEKDRTTGSGLSFSDLTGDLTNADLMALQNEVNELQDEMMLQDSRSELAEIENDMRSLERDLSKLRARGYAVEKSLESDISILAIQWDRVKGNAEATLGQQVNLLSEKMDEIQDDLAVLIGRSSNLRAARPLFIRLKSAVASAEAQADAAEDTVINQYDDYADEVDSVAAYLDWIGWMLDAISSASFQLLATESGVAAVDAQWEIPGQDAENGILFLTDQRILWEDRVGDFELKIAAALSQVSAVKEGVLKDSGDEFLDITFEGADTPVAKARFILSQPIADDWVKMLGRARSGEYAENRAVPIDEEEIERIRNAPQQCSNCGGAFTAPVLRGQNEIICEFCGVSTRI